MPMARVSDARSASEVSNSVEQLHPRLCWGWPGHDPGPNQRSGFVDGQGETCQRRPRTEQRADARFPTVLVVTGALDGAVHLRSWAAGRPGGYGLRSHLNGRERRRMRRKLRRTAGPSSLASSLLKGEAWHWSARDHDRSL